VDPAVLADQGVLVDQADPEDPEDREVEDPVDQAALVVPEAEVVGVVLALTVTERV